MQLDQIRGPQKVTVPVPAGWATAATVSEAPAFRAPFNLRVTAVRFVPETAITGNGTNNATVLARNKGTDGTGTTSIASKAFDTPTTDDVAAYDEAAIDLGAVVDRNVSAGEVVAIQKTVAGTGMVIDGIVEIEFDSRGV